LTTSAEIKALTSEVTVTYIQGLEPTWSTAQTINQSTQFLASISVHIISPNSHYCNGLQETCR